MAIMYAITCVASIVLVVLCRFSYNKNKNPYLLSLFIAFAVINTGYFALSVSPNLTLALTSNAVAYLGSVFLPLFVLVIVADLCQITVPKKLIIALVILASVVFIVASSSGYSQVYYETVSLIKTNGASALKKTYGPLHPLYKVYIITYLMSMIGIIIYSFVKRTTNNIKVPVFLAIIVLTNAGVWILETLLKSRFEYMAVSYVVTGTLLLLFYGIIRELSQPPAEEKVNPSNDYFTNDDAEKVFSQCTGLDVLSGREKEVMTLLLTGKKRKDIAEELFVSESTIKKHSASIYRKLGVENRRELLEKIHTQINT